MKKLNLEKIKIAKLTQKEITRILGGNESVDADGCHGKSEEFRPICNEFSNIPENCPPPPPPPLGTNPQ